MSGRKKFTGRRSTRSGGCGRNDPAGQYEDCFSYTGVHRHGFERHYTGITLLKELDFVTPVEERQIVTCHPAGTQFDRCLFDPQDKWFRFFGADDDIVFMAPKCNCCNDIGRLDRVRNSLEPIVAAAKS